MLIKVMWRTVWDEEFRLKLYDDSDGAEGQVLNLKVMRKEGREEELIGEGNVRIDGKSWREFDGESNPQLYESCIILTRCRARLTEWIELKKEGKYAGEVYCEMTFYPLEVQVRISIRLLRYVDC